MADLVRYILSSKASDANNLRIEYFFQKNYCATNF